jgi:hypothetical protein
MSRRIISTATLAIAIAALAAPAALARPADTPPAAATQEQEARPDAIDGYSQRPMNDRPSAPSAPPQPGPPTWPTDPEPISSARAGSASHDEGGVDWTTIGVGIAGSLLVLGAIAGITSRARRSGRARIAA